VTGIAQQARDRATSQAQQGKELLVAGDLVQLSQHDVEAIEPALRGTVVWRDDKWCLARAVFTAEQITNYATSHRTTSAARDAQVGVALAEGPIVVGATEWPFHAAAAVRIEGKPQVMIMDHLMAEQPIPLDEWARRLGLSPQSVRIQSATSSYVPGRGYVHFEQEALGAHTWTGSDYTSMGQLLSKTWNDSAREGQVVNPLFETPTDEPRR